MSQNAETEAAERPWLTRVSPVSPVFVLGYAAVWMTGSVATSPLFMQPEFECAGMGFDPDVVGLEEYRHEQGSSGVHVRRVENLVGAAASSHLVVSPSAAEVPNPYHIR